MTFYDMQGAMLCVPASTFLYGDGKEERELPEFWIGRASVTNAEYAHFVAATGYKPPEHWGGKVPPKQIADHPVTYVSWYDAVIYAEWSDKRLLAEEEWERAARGIDGREYPWGDWREGCCNAKEAGIGTTTRVGHYSPEGDSPCGCMDMAGNTFEWTASIDGNYRVLRGGAFNLVVTSPAVHSVSGTSPATAIRTWDFELGAMWVGISEGTVSLSLSGQHCWLAARR